MSEATRDESVTQVEAYAGRATGQKYLVNPELDSPD